VKGLWHSSRRSAQGARLEGARIYLRPPGRRDRDAWIHLRGASREFLEPWEPVWARESLIAATYRLRLRRQIQDAEDDTGYSFLMFRHEDNALLGGTTLSRVQRSVVQSAQLGYWTGQPFARQGYMTEALHCLLPHCFGRLALRRIEAACLPENEASRRLLERVGFLREGEAREYLKIAGQWRDHLLYALIAHEYRAPGI
jgi:[ribosomal protein S5]-alanine N-acetyltransferase